MSTLLVRVLQGWRLPASADGEVRKTFRVTTFESLCAIAMVGLVETNASAALVSLDPSKLQLALLGSAPLLLSAMTQLFTPYGAAFIHSRRWFCVTSVWLQALMIALVSVSGYVAASSNASCYVFLLMFALYAMTGGMSSSVWASWMADLVPQPIRGRFFALRNRILSIVQICVGMLSGVVIARVSGEHPPWGAFAAVFVMAGVFRVFSGMILSRVHEPTVVTRPPARDFTYLEFLRKTPTSNFARFVIFVALIHGTAAMAGPFFAPYMLRDLHLDRSYALYAFVNNAALLGTLVFLPFWGHVADKYGNLLVIRVGALITALVPVPYLFVYHWTWLWLAGFAAGVAWSGFGIASFNYVFEAVTPVRRIRCFSYLGATTGFSVFILGMTGGYLAQHVPKLPHCISPYQTLFLISAMARALVALVFLWMIKEVRHAVEPANAFDIFNEMPGVRPARDILSNLYRALRRM